MEKYKIIFLLNCHENKKSIQDTIKNIQKFNENSCIVLNDGTTENLDELKDDGVYVTKRKVSYSRFDTMVPLHIELKDCLIENNLHSDYVVMLSTNQLIIKKGFYDYIRNYKASFYKREIDFGCMRQLKNDRIFKKYYDELKEENFKLQSNHDGMFFEYKIFIDMIDYFSDFRGTKIHLHAEEFLYVSYLLKNIKIENMIDFEHYNYWQKNWRSNINPINIDELKECINKNFYIVKRISRDFDDEVRKYIREME